MLITTLILFIIYSLVYILLDELIQKKVKFIDFFYICMI